MVRFSALMRVPYPRTDPFTLRVSALIAGSTIAVTIGVALWQFLSSAKETNCISSASINYDSERCSPASLLFSSSYYTRSNSSSDIGMFPWIMGGFGNGTKNAPIDNSIQSWNYTGTLNFCQIFYTSAVLRLETNSYTVQACYYCGDRLRATCTLLDSERTQLTLGSGPQLTTLLANCDATLAFVRSNRAALSNSSITGITSRNYTAIPGLPSGILPDTFMNSSSQDYLLTTATAPTPLGLDDPNAAIRQLAGMLQDLSYYIQQVTSFDLNIRPFLVNYSCRDCVKVYKQWWKIVALVWAGTSAIVLAVYKLLVFLAGHVWGPEVNDDDDDASEKRSSITPYTPQQLVQVQDRSSYMPALNSNEPWRGH